MVSSLGEILVAGSRVKAQRPWPRAIVAPSVWRLAGELLANGRLVLLGLWGEATTVHMGLLNEEPLEVGVVSVEATDGTFPSVGAVHAPAIRLERTIHDLYGLKPIGLADQRPWLDHGRWGVHSEPKWQRHPLARRTCFCLLMARVCIR